MRERVLLGLLIEPGTDKIECRATARADLAQLVEQLFRKEQVWGSSPQVGSNRRRVGWEISAEVAESADALRSGRSGETRGSSNLPFGTVIDGPGGVVRTLTSE